MKNYKLLLIATLWLTNLANVEAQTSSLKEFSPTEYGRLIYWGKPVDLNREFFQILNTNWSNYLKTTAHNRKYFDFDDYQRQYLGLIENLKNTKFRIIVTEANTLDTIDSNGNLPDTSNKDKKSGIRASWIYYDVLLPSLQEFAKNKI